MKRYIPFLIIITLFYTLSLSASVSRAINIGDSRDTVISAFGVPTGCVERGNKEILCFSRGEVTLISGVVSKVNLRSDRQQVHYLDRQKLRRENVRQRIEALEKKRAERELEINQNQVYRDSLSQEAQQLENSQLAYHHSSGYPLQRRENFHRPFSSRPTPKVGGSHFQGQSRYKSRGHSNYGYSNYRHDSVNHISDDFRYRQQTNCSTPYNYVKPYDQPSGSELSYRARSYINRNNQLNRFSHINTHHAVHSAKLNPTQINNLAHVSHQGFRNRAQFCRNQNDIIRTNHLRNHQAAHLAKLNRQQN